MDFPLPHIPYTDQYGRKICKRNACPKNAVTKANTHIASTSITIGNVRSTSAKSKKTTTKRPKKRSLSHSNETTNNEVGTSYDIVQFDNAYDEDVVVYGKRPKQDKSVERLKEKDDIQGDESSDGLHSCPICLDLLKNTEVSATTCGHVFCKGCILAAIGKSKRCPLCLTPLTKKKIHPLYI